MDKESKIEVSFAPVFKGFIYAVGISAVLIILMSLFFHFTPLSESFLSVISLIIVFTSVFIGSFMSGKIAGNQGLIHGLAVAIIFLLFNLLISLMFGTEGLTLNSTISKTTITLISGALGGIAGISFSYN